jgi:ribosomal protein S18 acetylase RimI-like enzyme
LTGLSYSSVSEFGLVLPSVRLARVDDIDAVVALHRVAFADKFGGAFGRAGVDRGAQAIASAWRRQGAQALRGMYVATVGERVVGTATLRTWEMGSDDGGATEAAFQQVLGVWGALRSLYALSLIDHRIGRDEGFITDVAVAEAYRRRGIARQLLAHLEEEAALRHKHFLALYVSARNQGARRLYEQLGYCDARTRRSWLASFFFGQGRWIYMRKAINN